MLIILIRNTKYTIVKLENTNLKSGKKVADSWENCGFCLLSISHGSVATLAGLATSSQ